VGKALVGIGEGPGERAADTDAVAGPGTPGAGGVPGGDRRGTGIAPSTVSRHLEGIYRRLPLDATATRRMAALTW
jgi:hypothetical protein